MSESEYLRGGELLCLERGWGCDEEVEDDEDDGAVGDDKLGTTAVAPDTSAVVVLRAITVRGGESMSSSDCNTLSSSWPISVVRKWCDCVRVKETKF